MSSIEEPLFLRSGDYEIFALLHKPADADASRIKSAWVFCPPFTEEEKCSHRAFVDLARRLCDQGHAVLRIQYRGTGDSGGRFEEFSCLDWREDISIALTHLRELGYSKFGVLGLRLGATLAAQAAEANQEIVRLVLWEPIIDGKQYLSLNLRRKLLRKMLTEKEGGAPSQPGVTTPSDRSAEPDSLGGVDFDGYLVTQRLQDDLAGISLLNEVKLFRGAVLLTQISSQSSPGKTLMRLQECYEQAGARAETAAVVEQPIWNLMDLFSPETLIEKTVEWIETE